MIIRYNSAHTHPQNGQASRSNLSFGIIPPVFYIADIVLMYNDAILKPLKIDLARFIVRLIPLSV